MSETTTILAGDVDNPSAKVVRIACISDTHDHHMDYLEDGIIPDGDILVHTGDFFNRLPTRRHEWGVGELNNFFGRLPHKHKIFVAGNHDVAFKHKSREETQALLTTAIYLQDSGVTLEGIRFYGTPWTTYGKIFPQGFGFATSTLTAAKHWEAIPEDTDVVLTHQPPFAIRDLIGHRRRGGYHTVCTTCGERHPDFSHVGDKALLKNIEERVKPKVHIFGHVHRDHGTKLQNGTWFINAALVLHPQPFVVNYYIDPAAGSSSSLGSSGRDTETRPLGGGTAETERKDSCCVLL